MSGSTWPLEGRNALPTVRACGGLACASTCTAEAYRNVMQRWPWNTQQTAMQSVAAAHMRPAHRPAGSRNNASAGCSGGMGLRHACKQRQHKTKKHTHSHGSPHSPSSGPGHGAQLGPGSPSFIPGSTRGLSLRKRGQDAHHRLLPQLCVGTRLLGRPSCGAAGSALENLPQHIGMTKTKSDGLGCRGSPSMSRQGPGPA